jgi:hypothetical protein
MTNGSAYKGWRLHCMSPWPRPSNDEIRLLINVQQQDEIAFQLHSMTQAQMFGRSVLLECRTYEG